MNNELSVFRSLRMLVAIVVGGVFVACNPIQEKEFSITFKEAGAGYVVVNASMNSATEISFVCQEEELGNLDRNLVFMMGKKQELAKSGEYRLMADVKENTNYHLYVVARLSAKEYSDVYVFDFTTSEFAFSELCTVTATAYDGYKMHITVPESVRSTEPRTAGSKGIRYTQSCLMMYNTMRQRYDEYWMLLTNAGPCTTEDVTVEYSDELNRTQSTEDMNEDGVVDEKDQTIRWNPISPGEPVVFMAGEFEWMELPPEYQGKDAPNYVVDGWAYPAGWEAGYYLPMIDGEKYDAYYNSGKTKGMGIINDIDVSSELDEAWTGAFQKKIFRTALPEKLDGTVEVEVSDVGPVDATLTFTPSSNVLFYSVVILDEELYGEMLKLLDGKEEYVQWATASYFAMANFGAMYLEGRKSVVLSDIFYDVPADTEYMVLVTGMGDEKGSKQFFERHTFSTPPKTKTSGPAIEVTALEEESSPFVAKFHVKCTSVADNPVKKCYYGANYYRDWIYAINKGGTYLEYGKSAEFSEADVVKINSDEGLVVEIPTIDGETTRLVVVGLNDENTPNDLNYEDITECPAVADLTTPYAEADLCPAYYDLRSKLAGDWTMSAMVIDDSEANTRKTLTKNVSILAEYTDYPREITDEIYDVYHENTKWTDAEIEGYFQEFIDNVSVFNHRRLENQNKLLLSGWLDGGVDSAYVTMTPYDLFVHERISTVDVKSCFSDFGPKMFLEVSEDESGAPKVTITADMYYGSPVMNWSDPFYMAGYADQATNNTIFYYSDPVTGYYAAPLVFDVEISDNYETITIKAIEGSNGIKYYPNVIGQDSTTGRYLINNPVVSDVVLTKGHTAVEQTVKPAGKVSVRPAGDVLEISRKHMTRFERHEEVPVVEAEVMTVEKASANIDRYVERYLRSINNRNR